MTPALLRSASGIATASARRSVGLLGAALALLVGCATNERDLIGETEHMNVITVNGEAPLLPEVVIRDLDVMLRQWQEVHNDNDFAQSRSMARKLGAKALQHYPALINGLIEGAAVERRVGAAALGFLRPDEDDPRVMDELKMPQAVGYLTAYGLADEDASVRAATLWSLGRIARGDTKLSPIVALLKDDLEPPAVRSASLYALGRLYHSELDTPDRQYFYGVLNRLADTHPFVREAAVFALLEIGDERCVEHLVAYSLNDTDHRVRLATMFVLEGFEDPKVVPEFVRLLSDKNDDIVIEAMKVLRTFDRDPRVQEALRRQLQHKEAKVRGAAATHLGAFEPSDKTRDALVAVAKNRAEEESVRVAAVKALAQSGDRSLVPDLVPLLDERGVGLVEAAALALQEVSSQRAISDPFDPYLWEQWAQHAAPVVEFPEDYKFHLEKRKKVRPSSLSSGGTTPRPATARPQTQRGATTRPQTQRSTFSRASSGGSTRSSRGGTGRR